MQANTCNALGCIADPLYTDEDLSASNDKYDNVDPGTSLLIVREPRPVEPLRFELKDPLVHTNIFSLFSP